MESIESIDPSLIRSVGGEGDAAEPDARTISVLVFTNTIAPPAVGGEDDAAEPAAFVSSIGVQAL